MKVSAAEIRKLEDRAIRDFGIPSVLLMENAGRSVADVISRHFPPCKTLIVAGKGNNAGDGFVVARHLCDRGYPVKILCLSCPDSLKPDARLNFEIVRNRALPVTVGTNDIPEETLLQHCCAADLVVDAIFGLGINSRVTNIFEKAIRAIRESGKPVVSIDIPSGLDADTGEVHGIAVHATRTVTLALPKSGLYTLEGPSHAGMIDVVDIGIPRELLLPYL